MGMRLEQIDKTAGASRVAGRPRRFLRILYTGRPGAIPKILPSWPVERTRARDCVYNHAESAMTAASKAHILRGGDAGRREKAELPGLRRSAASRFARDAACDRWGKGARS